MSATTLFQSHSHSSSRPTLLALFLFSDHFNNVTKVPVQIGARCVALEGEQKLTCLPRQHGGSLMSVFTLREDLRHKVTKTVALHHKQNTLRCHLHTLVCTLSRMYNVPNRIHFAAIFIHLYAHFHECTTSTRNYTTAQRRDSKLTSHGSATELRPFSIENNIRCSARSDHMSQILRALHSLNFLSNPAFSIDYSSYL